MKILKLFFVAIVFAGIAAANTVAEPMIDSIHFLIPVAPGGPGWHRTWYR